VRVDAKVVSKRVAVSGGENSTATDYYATFELANGERREFEVKGREYGLLAENDAGQLQYQGSWYLGFCRAPAPEKPPVVAAPPAPANLVCDYCRSAIPEGSIKCSNCGWTWHPAPQNRTVS